MAINTLRPNAVGDESNLTTDPGDGESNYEDVDDVTPDYLDSGVYTTNAEWTRDLYGAEDSDVTGVISKVVIHAVCESFATPEHTNLKICVKAGSTTDEGDEQTTTTGCVTYEEEWALNPGDNEAWEWADIDSLQIGVSMRNCLVDDGVFGWTYCTQVYMEVYYQDSVGGYSIYSKSVLGKVIKDSRSYIPGGEWLGKFRQF